MALAGSPAFGQSLASNEVETITVTATRTPQATDKVGSAVTIIDQTQIFARGSIAVSDLLGSVTGVSVSRNGGLGSLTSVRIRGAEADQTLVLIDGIKLNDPASPGGGFDFGNLLVGDVARIEVLRGPQSTLYGSQAIGGVVNVISQTAQTPFAGSLDLEAGDLASARARGAVRGRLGDFSYSGAAGYVTTDGISSAAIGRERDGFEHKSLQGRLAYAFSPALELEARAWWAKGVIGIDGFPPPIYAFTDTNETSETEQAILYAGANLVLLDGRSRTRIGYNRASTDRLSTDPAQKVKATFIALGTNQQLDVQSTLDVTETFQLLAGGEFEASRLRVSAPNDFDPSPSPLRASTRITGLYVQAQIDPTPWLSANLGVRQTTNSRFGDAITLRATFAARFNDGHTIVRGVMATGFKAPTLYQSLSEYGNVALVPEEASSSELGVEQALLSRKIVASLTYFARDTRNQIDFTSCFNDRRAICTNRPFGVYDNIAQTKATGIEAGLDLRPNQSLTVSLGYTALDTTNRSANSANFGKDLARRPRQSGFATLTYNFASGINLSASYTRTGASFNDGGNRQRLAGFDLFSLGASQRIGEQWSIYARIENAGDVVYQTAAGYGSLPRQGFVGLRATF
jgi:vitamin B12 transporter